MESPDGPDPTLPIDALLAELDQSAEKPHVKTAIKKAVVERQNQVDGEMLLAGLQMDDNMHHSSSTNLGTHVPTNRTSSSSSSSAVRQSSAAAQASQKQPRQAQPLKMVETDASKHRLTYAQATMAVATTLIEQPQRLPTQRVVKPTPFLGEYVGHDAPYHAWI